MFRRKRLPHRYHRRPGAACTWLTLLLALGGSISLGHGVAAQQQITPTKPAGSVSRPVKQTDSKPQAFPAGLNQAPASLPVYLPYSVPTKLEIPPIGVSSDLTSVGKTADGAMEVPTYPNFDTAAWYRHSPAPGQYGASIIVGHVDSATSNGASVFFNLSKLKPMDTINVTRADGQTAHFVVRAIRAYGKNGLPDGIIYSPVTDNAELRLITCSGSFDESTGAYDSNTVVFATLAAGN